MDFSKLRSAPAMETTEDPIKIFEVLPSLEYAPNDLWRGQTKALTEWYEKSSNRDILITLNTGAGKTIVGLLIAQSLVNSDVDNVVYVCSTNDLVEQTSKEASRIGIKHTIRARGEYSNDYFETGEAFCITTYAALFNAYSAIRNKYFPGAVIFDDAHVAETILRDSFSLRFKFEDNNDLFREIAELFRPIFDKLEIIGQFEKSLDSSEQSATFVPPKYLYKNVEQLLEILKRYGINSHDKHKFPFALLEDKLRCCAAMFSGGEFELTPPFLPSLALDIFEQDVKRIYLSATLQSDIEFIRAFGRVPDVIIEPPFDTAGNGERLILDSKNVEIGFGPEFAKHLIGSRKAIISVPNYRLAEAWSNVARPPRKEEFSKELEKFRSKDTEVGAFILVSRVDGIDLPHDTCRIMIMGGIPSASSLLERYQWERLNMDNVHASRVANRLVQLFGRINRGRNDFGVFLIEGEENRKWLLRKRNLALLPPLLRRQITIGQQVKKFFEPNTITGTEVCNLIDQVLGRDKEWLRYYQDQIKTTELNESQNNQVELSEEVLVEATLSEAKYAAATWNGDFSTARKALEKTIASTATHDAKLAGWHSLWIGAVYDRIGDPDSARRAYDLATKRLTRSLKLHRTSNGLSMKHEFQNFNEFGRTLSDLLSHSDGAKFEKEMKRLNESLKMIESKSANESEAGVRQLGELLGFRSTRPDNDVGTGPDVLWLDEEKFQMIGLELKTQKNQPAIYSKKEISQGLDHLEWMRQNHPNYNNLGLLFVGPSGSVHNAANPSKKMALCLLESLVALRDKVIASIEDISKAMPIERHEQIKSFSDNENWRTNALFDRLSKSSMTEMKSKK